MRKKRRSRKSRRTGLGLIAIMVLLVCGIVTYKRQELDHINTKSAAQIAELKDEIELEQEKTLDIQEMRAYIQTLKYVEEMAREKLGLVYKDEIIFKSDE